ncbi:uncharacterized protein [Dermacentor andersoni]|uniref:uncharacterized protein n=1 Tax=Dermacentor andersoni TaxID=34620 RepID=UPI003B3A8544
MDTLFDLESLTTRIPDSSFACRYQCALSVCAISVACACQCAVVSSTKFIFSDPATLTVASSSQAHCKSLAAHFTFSGLANRTFDMARSTGICPVQVQEGVLLVASRKLEPCSVSSPPGVLLTSSPRIPAGWNGGFAPGSGRGDGTGVHGGPAMWHFSCPWIARHMCYALRDTRTWEVLTRSSNSAPKQALSCPRGAPMFTQDLQQFAP